MLLALVLAMGVGVDSADAQVFKQRSKTGAKGGPKNKVVTPSRAPSRTGASAVAAAPAPKKQPAVTKAAPPPPAKKAAPAKKKKAADDDDVVVEDDDDDVSISDD